MKNIKIFIKKYFKYAIYLAAVLFTINTLRSELASIDFQKVYSTMQQQSLLSIAILIMVGLVAVSTLSFYDFILVRSLKIDVNKFAMGKVSLISNTLNNVLGFGGIIGATIRYNYLEKFVEEEDKKNLKKSISFMLFSMLSGIAVLSILVVIGIFDSTNLIEDYPYVKIALITLSIILPIYLIYTFIKPPLESDRFLVLKYTMVSVLDYLFVGCIMFLSLRFVGANVNFMNMISIFVVASIAGVISMIPGGIGVFDVIFLVGATTQLNLSEEVVLLAVIFYRLCYNILPFFLGSLVALTEFQTVLKGKFKEQSIVLFTKEFGSIIFSITKKRIQSLSRLLITILFTIATVIYIQNSSLALLYNLENYYDITMIIATSIYLIMSAFMIPNIFRIYQGSGETYKILLTQLSILLLCQAIILLKDGYKLDIIITLLLLIVLYFYRKLTTSRVDSHSFRDVVIWAFTIIVVMIQIETLWMFPEFLLPQTIKHLQYSIYSFIAIWLIGIVVYHFVLRKKYSVVGEFRSAGWGESKEDFTNLLQTYQGTNLAHLGYLTKNRVAINPELEMGIVYQENRHFVFILGDPFGNLENDFLFLQELNALCHKIGKKAVFYQVSTENIYIYNELNNLLFNLGEEGLVNLKEFKITGNSGKPYRKIMNKQEAEGYTFAIEPMTDELGHALKEVSDEWLHGAKEMTFSVGSLDVDYLKAAEIATLRDESDNVVAFTSVMPTYKEGSISVDLIRWKDEEHVSSMDILYLNMILWAQEEGYEYFNIGMAPLSSSFEKTNSLLYTLTSSVYQHSSNFYSFKGIRNYKNKFKPEWSPRYLVYPKRTSLLRVVLESYRIIHPK